MSTDFSQHRLGKLPPSDKPALMLKEVLTGIVPDVPLVDDHFAKVPAWNMGGNQTHGTCGPTGVSNNILLTTTYLTDTPVVVTIDDIYDLYRRSGNPGFFSDLPEGDPNQQDNGVVLQDMLNELRKNGIGGHKPLAFAKIAPGDTETLDKAIAIFGSALLGLALKVPQQTQTTWDSVGGADWGGHCVLAGRYAQDRAGVITWAQAMDMTPAFVHDQEDEAWVIIWEWHLGSATFLAGVDTAALASAYQSLTGDPLPLPAG